MHSDLVQRAAAICGYPFTPNSDQLAAWLGEHRVTMQIDSASSTPPCEWWAVIQAVGSKDVADESADLHPTLLEALAAAVVEVGRIEREAKQP